MTAPSPVLTSPVVTLTPSTTPPSSRTLSITFALCSTSPSTPLPDGDLTINFPSHVLPPFSTEPQSARSDASGHYTLLSRDRTGQTEPSSAASYQAPWHASIPEEDETLSSPQKYAPDLTVPSPTDTAGPPTARQGEFDFNQPLPTGAPLSTAKLLEFENGPRFTDLKGHGEGEGEDLWSFFRSRPIVQAPTHMEVREQVEVLFLLAPEVEVPERVQVVWNPAWTQSDGVVLAEIGRGEFVEQPGGERRWAGKRIEDLEVLQEIARELEEEGARGVGLGRVKVGVEGGGMDEEAVRREGYMVGEEIVWVREEFLKLSGSSGQAGKPGLGLQTGLEGGLAGLGIGGAQAAVAGSEVVGGRDGEEEEEEDELFAMPLSPRSPDMAKSPFAMWRGEREPVEVSPIAQVLNG